MTTRHLCGWTRKTTPEKRRSFYSGTIKTRLTIFACLQNWYNFSFNFHAKNTFFGEKSNCFTSNFFMKTVLVSPRLNCWWWKLHPKYFEPKVGKCTQPYPISSRRTQKKMVFASHAFFASAALQMNPNILAFLTKKMLIFVLRIREFCHRTSVVPKQVRKI